MKARARSVLLLSVTLLLGMALGALIQAQLFGGRMKRFHSMRSEEGFVSSYLQTIQPASPEQEQAITSILGEAAVGVVSAVKANREDIHRRMNEMREKLYPLLDETQRARVEARAQRYRSRDDADKK